MDYQTVLDYLFSQLPMFHRIGPAAYKADLSNTVRLMELLGHPEDGFKSIHVAGTNGKGSTSHMLAAVLQAAGYRTGLYTSPHLLDFRERVRINGKKISREAVVGFVEKHRAAFDEIQPSFFEWTVALAFDHFRNEAVDIAVIETGLGGRLDSTNVIRPEISVVTNIGWDHANLLGDTLQKIAGEKAGIIKAGIPVVVGERDTLTDEVFRSAAANVGASISFAADYYTATQTGKDEVRQKFEIRSHGEIAFRDIEVDLLGSYQQKNIVTVLHALEILKSKGWSVSEQQLREGLCSAAASTGLMGRWQRIGSHPAVICDVGHNPDGIRLVVEQLKHTAYRHLRFVLGMVGDKDVSAVLKELPATATYYFCQPSLPRALPVEQLEVQATLAGLSGKKYPSVAKALQAAIRDSEKEDLVFVGGSTFVVSEAIGSLQ